LQLFLDIYGFLNVVLRGFILAVQSLTGGGVAFLILALPRAETATWTRSRRMLFWGAVALSIAEALSAAGLLVLLHGTLEQPLLQLLDVHAVLAALAASALAAAIAFVVRADKPLNWAAALCLGLLATQVTVTHAVSRSEHAPQLFLAEFAHMAGVAVWIGGIPYFLLSLLHSDLPARRRIAARFSAMSVGSVATLVAAGFYLASEYVGDAKALYGSSYGVMLSAKIVLLAALLMFGGMNFLTVRRWKREPGTSISSMRRFAETEIGVGLTVLFCAASLASLPPAREMANDWASAREVVGRVAPQWPPRLESPDHASLSTSQQSAVDLAAPAPPRTDEDIAWSEYNHHWAGIFVLLMGCMALAEHIERLAPIARHWPLVFLGLGAFIFVRADEAAWPLGHMGFFESLRDPEIAQHKLLTLLVFIFGVFEWRVRVGALRNSAAAYVFPLVIAAAAAFLLTHSHGLTNPKEEMLIEVSHTPLALVGVAAGWSRWLELRLDRGAAHKIASVVWPVSFVFAGLLLLFYREA
jgi:putative copper resistance protein D